MRDIVTRARLEELARQALGAGAYVGKGREVLGAWKIEAHSADRTKLVTGRGMTLRHAYRDLAGALILMGD